MGRKTDFVGIFMTRRADALSMNDLLKTPHDHTWILTKHEVSPDGTAVALYRCISSGGSSGPPWAEWTPASFHRAGCRRAERRTSSVVDSGYLLRFW